ncbi:MAG: T9SS type A sorting domain-containing protein [Bacteroidetes bacterium]|nr:T9SS type A sorting domain-containing protein [Bacteroidota bacterium]
MLNLKSLLLTLSILFVNNAFVHSITPIWSSFYAGTGDNSDRYNSIISDGSGNFVAVGYTIRAGNYRDFLVVKMDANGDTIWTRTKNGKNAGDDEAVSAVVDGSGNIFVVGSSDGGNSNLDILLLKYDASGNRLFDTTWNSPAYFDDIPVAMAMDPSGNIIIGGNAEPDTVSGSNHYVTLKYSPAGSLLWATEFSRTGAKHEMTGLVVDGSGDVYVTGRSASLVDDDFATIKYSGANGSQLWLQVYNSGNGNDRAAAIILDNAGDVIVTGRSKSANNDDFRTVKYSGAGSLLWSKFYNAPANQDDRALAIGVDATNNIYVTGQSDIDNSSSINYDFATVKYNSAGTQQWSKLTGSIFIQDDIPASLKIDGSGNIFITGKSDQDPGTTDDNDWMTVMYNTGGTLLWTQFKNGTSTGNGDTPGGLILSGSDILVVGSLENTGSQKDAAVIKYDAAGSEVFVKQFNGDGDFDESARSIIIDSNDISYTAGYVFHQDENRNASIVQTSPGGTTTCTYTFNGIKNDDDEFYDLALSPNGRIYAIGYTKVSGQKSNFLLVKYDPTTCDTLWTRTYDYIGQSDKAEFLAVDAAGNIYVSGRSDSSPLDSVDNNDIVTIKYDSNGNQQWIQRYNGSGNMRDEPSKILINGNGEILICGRTENVHDDDFILLKYEASTGNPVWAQPAIYGGPFANDDRATNMTIDASNNIYVCGYSQTGSAPANEDPVVIKYDDSGNIQGFYSYVALGEDEPVAISHDLTGNIFVAFRTDVDPDPLTSNFNFLTMKFDSGLNPVWATPPQYDSPINQDDEPADLIVSPNGDVYVIGTSENDSSGGRINKNWLTLVYSTSGSQLAISNYDGPNGTDDSPNGLAIRGSSLWVCGYTEGTNNSQRNNTVVRYDSLISVNELAGLKSSIVYPNPFNQSATISIENESSEKYSLVITDIAGAIVSEISFFGNKTEIHKGNLAAGIYQYSISAKSTVVSRGKFVIN